ncbi:MAG: RNA 3'-terminal phosphate cyclase [Thermoplasmatales archaeon]|nr:RNA 3'-terminal phosphate cyclase [Thermoplasmatales archaeon]
MIEIDGSYGEGGGQMLRMSIAFSSITKKPVRIFNIRANRPNPGLRNQHIASIETVSKICNANVKGLKIGSSEIEFYPREIEGGEYEFDVGTAGSIALVLQACIIPSIFAEKETKLILKGGTDVRWAPPWDYFKNVFLEILRKMGIEIYGKLHKRGYYPAGGGKVEVIIKPCKEIRPIYFDEKVEEIEGIVNISNLPVQIAERIKKSVEENIKDFPKNIRIEKYEAISPGVGIVLWSKPKILGADCLGEKGRRAEEIGESVSKKILEEIYANVDLDEKAVDQIIPFLAISGYKTCFKCKKISNHATTELFLLKKFLDLDAKVSGNDICEVEINGKKLL